MQYTTVQCSAVEHCDVQYSALYRVKSMTLTLTAPTSLLTPHNTTSSNISHPLTSPLTLPLPLSGLTLAFTAALYKFTQSAGTLHAPHSLSVCLSVCQSLPLIVCCVNHIHQSCWVSAVPHSAVHSSYNSMLQLSTVLCDAMQYNAIQYNTS